MRGNWRRGLLGAWIVLVGWPMTAAGQGAGSAGAATLTLTPGTRAAAFAGAYTAVTGDPDAVFYNPAAVAWLGGGVGLGYEEYVEDITLGYLAGGIDAGPLGVGAGVVYLDAGEIHEVVPDPGYGGERGRRTGETVSATETAMRVAAALPFLGRRASMGLAVGVATSDLAGVQRSVAFLDVGTQYRHRLGTLGATIRNVDIGLGSDEAAGDLSLPLEARIGAAAHRNFTDRYGAMLSTDVVLGVKEETLAVAVGGEAGLLPRDGAVTAVLRAGTTLGGGDHLGRLRVGGGIGVRGLSVDYAIQSFEYLGAIHRVGVRWAR